MNTTFFKNTIFSLIIVILLFLFIYYSAGTTQSLQVIRIGAILPLSGLNSSYGEEIKNGIELAVEEINNSGGINGKKIKIIYEDDKSDPKVGVTAMQKLTSIDRVSVVLGPWSSGVALAVAPIAQQLKTVLLAEAIAPTITASGNYVFTIQPSAVQYSQKLMQEVVGKMGLKRIAIIYSNNDFGISLRDTCTKEVNKLGGLVMASESYTPGDSDFKSQLLKIKDMNPEALFIAGYQEQVIIIKQANQMGLKTKFLAGPPFENAKVLENLGSLAEDVIYPYHFVTSSNAKKTLDYEESYKTKFGVPSSGFAPLMYDGIYLVTDAIKICGLSTSCIKDVLTKTNYKGVAGDISFDENRNPILPITLKTVKNGQFVEY